jgi:RHS repeat-associated protein
MPRGERSRTRRLSLRVCLLVGLASVALSGGGFGDSSALASVPSSAIRYLYTPDSELSAVIKPEAEAALYNWDSAGNLSSITRRSSTKLSIIQLEPTTAAVGETVDIWGTGFSTTPSSDTVKFHGTAATVTAATAYTLAVKVPTGATSGTVTVQTPTEGPVTSSQSFTVSTAAAAPTITSISTSLALAGTTVTMSGTNFETQANKDIVKVNQTDAELTSETSTSIKFVIPEAASSGHVSIVTPQGSATGPILYVPPPGYSTSQVGPTAVLSAGTATALSITAPKTIGLALVEGKAGEELSVLLAHSTIGQAWAAVYTPVDAKMVPEQVFDSGGAEPLYEPGVLPLTGMYTILIRTEGEDTGSVKLTPYLAANTTGTLSPTTSGASESVSLPTPGQTATYSVSGSAGEEVSVKTTETTLSGSYRLEWLNPEGRLIDSYVASGNALMASLEFPTAGTYKLVVNPEGTVTGSTKLTAYSDVTASFTPTTGGESRTLTTGVPDQNADVTFSGTEGKQVSFELSEMTIGEAWVTIYSPNGSTLYLTHSFLGGGTSLIGPLTLPATGTYRIVISPQKEDTGQVKLTAYSVVDVTGSLSPTTSGDSEIVSLPTPGQTATYSVSGGAGEEVSVKTTETAFSGTYMLRWLNPEGKAIGEYFASGNGFMDSVKFPAEGTYKLLVAPQGVATGSMKLTAYNSTAATASITPTIGGESKTVTMNVPGQNGDVTFSGTEGHEVSFVLSEITTTSVWVTIYTPSGSTLYLTHVFSGGTEPAIGPFTLPATGTYTIELNPYEEDTGSVKVSAYIGSPPHGLIVRRPPSTTSSTTSTQAADLASPASGVLGDLRPAVLFGGQSSPSLASDPSRAPFKARRRRSHMRVRRLAPKPVSAGAVSARLHAGGSWAMAEARTFGAPFAKVARSLGAGGSGQWRPTAQNRRGLAWRTQWPASPWTKLALPAAAPEATALAGQALKLNGLPLAGLRVAIANTAAAARTDAAGEFLLPDVPAGHQVLVVEGSSIGGSTHYGTFEIGVQVTAHQENTLGAPIWMTPLDPAGNHRVASPTKSQVVLTSPRIPGLEVRLPAGTVIHDAAGHVVRDLNITAIPVDRPPFPLPAFVSVPVYFTVQPGRAYLSKGAQIVYPNYTHLPAGQRVDFWNYDAAGRGWYIYGQGSVTPNGKQVVPDPGVRVWEFTGSMISGSTKPPKSAPKPGASSKGGDPVDLGTGLLTYHKTDLVIPDTIPIVIERTYRQEDSNSYSFGIGTTNLYDLRLWSENNYHEADLVLPDGGTVLYKRTSPGEGYKEAEYQATKTPSIFYGSTLKWSESDAGWDLTLTDGTTYVFGLEAPLDAIRNRQGQQLTITRESGETGNITQITSPHGHWVKFTYDSSNRIKEIKDNSGRTLKYAYTSGLLTSATDPAERTAKYEYDGAGDMTSITNGRGIKYLETKYDTNDRVSKQIDGDGGVFEFSYALGGSGNVESTTVTEPRENKRKVTFNSEGYPTSETEGVGSAVEETTTFERQAGTGFLLSSTDARSRKTTYEYDGYGNVTALTRLAGTSSAQTYKYTYEPQTDEVTKETDPLSHSTTYEYNGLGERTSTTDALGHKTKFEYNSEGLPSVITNPLGKKTTIGYEAGLPVSVTDPLGRTTKQFVDPVGRVLSTTAPGGQRTSYEYNKDNQITKLTDPLGASTSYEYDGDGNLISTTDPLKHKSSMAYDKMDRLESETDPLEHKTTAVYDKAGNITQLTDRRGKVSKFSYDALNRLTEAKFGVSGETAESTIAYSYDNGNRLTKIVDSTAGTYTPEYDELNRLKSLATPGGTISYTYDEANRRTSMTVPGQEALKYTYDEANRLKELKRGSQAISFAYDEANRPTKTTLVDGVEEQYGYDEANELTSIAYKKGSTTLGELDYSYDLDGRREAVWGSYARTSLPEALSATYNADNEQTERGGKKLSYDANGNLTSDGSSEYKWNARNQLTSITGANKATYAYDPFGRRITRTVGSTTTELLYDGPNVVQESQSGSAIANLITGLAPDKSFARTTSKATENLLTDALGSTVGLAGATGTVETTYTYDPFGATTREGTASENPFQYAGRENDGDGLYDNRARYYSPAGDRFISQDPLGQEGGGSNLYLYTGDSPTNATDPYGTSLKTPTPTTTTGPGLGAAGAPGGGQGGTGSSGGFGPGPSSCPGGRGNVKGKGLSGGGSWLQEATCSAEEGLQEQNEESRKHHCMPGEVVINHQCTNPPDEPPGPPTGPPHELPIEEEPLLFPLWPVPVPIPEPLPG